MSTTPYKKIDESDLKDLIELFKSEKRNSVSIICHDQPDPDCLASAMAIQHIADEFKLESKIYYGGEIPYTQNSVMMNVLNISAIKLESDESESDESDLDMIREAIKNSYLIVVDTSCSFGKENNTGICEFLEENRNPDVVIDHHYQNHDLECIYIHENYGSCSSIMYEILSTLKINISKGLATALYLGISTDTADLKSEGTVQNDVDALENLKKLMDIELLRKIYDYPKPLALLELRKRAYNDFCIFGNNLTISNVGIINPQQRALLAKLSEEMLQVESIDSCLILGLVDEGFDKPKYITASFRTNVLAINTGQFVQKIFGKKYSGGRKGAGAAKIPLDEKTCSVIDFIRRKENGESHEEINKLIMPFFDFYIAKAKEEKNNV